MCRNNSLLKYSHPQLVKIFVRLSNSLCWFYLSSGKLLHSHKSCINPPFAKCKRNTLDRIKKFAERNLIRTKKQPMPINCQFKRFSCCRNQCHIHMEIKYTHTHTQKNRKNECIEKYTSELWNSSCDISFKKSVIKQPTKRPSGIINSWLLEMENMTSDKELKTNRTIRVHFNAFCPRKSNRSISVFSAFFHGISLTESGMASHNFSLKILICILTFFGSPNSAIDAFIEHVGKVWRRARNLKDLCSWQGWPWKCLTCTKGKIYHYEWNFSGCKFKFLLVILQEKYSLINWQELFRESFVW